MTAEAAPDLTNHESGVTISRKQSASEVLLFGLVRAVGTRIDTCIALLRVELERAGFKVYDIRLSEMIASHPLTDPPLQRTSDDYEFYIQHMAAGDRIRIEMDRADAVVLAGLEKVVRLHDELRSQESGPPRVAFIVHSLCHPAEVALMRRIFGRSFFLIAAFEAENQRRKELASRFAGTTGELEEQIQTIIDIDQGVRPSFDVLREASPANSSQEELTNFKPKLRLNVRRTFHLADLFISCENSRPTDRGTRKIRELIEQICSNPFATPDKHEMGMAYAYQASIRSADLSRRVGAAIARPTGEVIVVGTNDAPSPGGGLYWQTSSQPDYRDFRLGHDSNERIKTEIVAELIAAVTDEVQAVGNPDPITFEALKSRDIRKARIFDITEYGRTVHAEMDAITTAARLGQSIIGCTLYTTTFPCHECARHIVASGIAKVIYVEPYPKSRVAELHSDAVIIGDHQAVTADDVTDRRIRFEPFIGLAPHRHADLFSQLPRKQSDLNETTTVSEPWRTVYWRLAPDAGIRPSILDDFDPFLDEFDRGVPWDRLRIALSQAENLISEVRRLRETSVQPSDDH